MADSAYRLLRILEYTGSREFIDDAMERRGVKGTKRVPSLGGVIREALLGDTPELIDDYIKDYGKAEEEEQQEPMSWMDAAKMYFGQKPRKKSREKNNG